MPTYVIDTSGLSNPLENMPEDIYASLWTQVIKTVDDGKLCCNTEILKELHSLGGRIGECIGRCGATICYEVDNDSWPWRQYIDHVDRLITQYRSVIAEYSGNRKSTVGMNDISIIALAMTLQLPLISMEKENLYQPSQKKMRIPDVCKREGVPHLTFNGFLRAEGITL